MKTIKKRTLILLTAFALIIIAIVIFLVLSYPKDEKIVWAQNLKVEDVAKIEVITMPNNQYKTYDTSEIAGVVKIINGARGKRVDAPNPIVGGSTVFYITDNVGTRHQFANNGNIYLVIDDVSFDAGYNWLSSWGNQATNDKIPDDFEY